MLPTRYVAKALAKGQAETNDLPNDHAHSTWDATDAIIFRMRRGLLRLGPHVYAITGRSSQGPWRVWIRGYAPSTPTRPAEDFLVLEFDFGELAKAPLPSELPLPPPPWRR